MKNSLRLLVVAFAILAGASAFAQTSGSTTPPARGPKGPPPGIVNSDGTITLPDGTVLQPPTLNADGSITLPDGTVLPAPPVCIPPVKNADGSIRLPDGTVIQPNADGTYTMPDGDVIDLSKAPPAGGPDRHGPHGPPPSGG